MKIDGCGLIVLFIIILVWAGTCNSSTKEHRSDWDYSSTPNKPVVLTIEQKMISLRNNYIAMDIVGKIEKSGIETMEGIGFETEVLIGWSDPLINLRNITNLSDDDKKFVNKYKVKLKNLQRKNYPILRDRYGIVFRKILWEADASARTIGNKYTTVEVISSTFILNRNIKEFHNKSLEMFNKLRFKKAVYKRYKGVDEWTYYTIDSPDDGELGNWEKGVFISGD